MFSGSFASPSQLCTLTAVRGWPYAGVSGAGWQVAFLSSRAALCLLQGERRADAVCGLGPRSGCGCHSPLSCWVVAALCPRVQGVMAGLSPGLL